MMHDRKPTAETEWEAKAREESTIRIFLVVYNYVCDDLLGVFTRWPPFSGF